MTHLDYRHHPDLFELSAQVTRQGIDAKGMYVVFNQSLFYPQGGGQPADQGHIITDHAWYAVFDVRTVDHEIRHYIMDNSTPLHPHDTVHLKIEKERRILHSKYHTAGHLIAAVAEQEDPNLQVIKGHQFPGEAFVEFTGTVTDVHHFLDQISAQVSLYIGRKLTVTTKELCANDANIAQDGPYARPQNTVLRVCHIDGFLPVPCGGTHVNTLDDIVSLTLKKCTSKKGKTKIYYRIDHTVCVNNE